MEGKQEGQFVDFTKLQNHFEKEAPFYLTGCSGRVTRIASTGACTIILSCHQQQGNHPLQFHRKWPFIWIFGIQEFFLL